MAEPGDDRIDGKPDEMRGFNVVGPARVDPTLDLLPGMAEGKAFATVDSDATKRVREYMFQATHGIESYSRTAKASGQDYLDADAAGAGIIHDVTDVDNQKNKWAIYYA